MKRAEILRAIENFEPISQSHFFRYAKSIMIMTEAYNYGEAIAFPVGITNVGASAFFIGTSHDYHETIESILNWYGITDTEEREHEGELISFYAKPISHFIK